MKLVEIFRANPSNASAHALLVSQLKQNAARTDRFFAGLLTLQWIASIVAAVLISPLTWSGSQSSPHAHLYAAVFLGGAIVAFPVWHALRNPGRALTRHSIAIAQMLTSALLIHLLAGRIEAHFHIFGSLAFLAFYLDASVLLTATVVTLVDHVARGIWYPESIYGVLTPSNWRWAEHAGWVVFENVFLLAQCRARLREMETTANTQARLEASHRDIEAQICERTSELAEARDRALESARQKSTFLSMVTHEFRTPMNGLMGFHQLLRNTELDAEQTELLELADSSCQRFHHRVTDILDHSALSSGQIELDSKWIDFIAWLDLFEQQLGAACRENGLDFTSSHRGFEHLRSVELRVDVTRFEQLLRKLSDNALALTKQGGLSLRTQVLLDRYSSSKIELEIALQDTGIGLANQDVEQLFQPFYQVDSTLSRSHQGMGLGLAICRALAQLMDGDVYAENVEGAGACFTARVKLDFQARADAQPQTPLKEAPEPRDLTRSREVVTDAVPTKRTVLVVDDNAVNLKLAKRLVENAGFEATTAENGQQAVESARRHDLALILMDCQMPVMDGHEATRQIRRLAGPRAEVPIIAVTANCSSEDRALAFASGMDEFLDKPLNSGKLQSAMQAWCGRRHAS